MTNFDDRVHGSTTGVRQIYMGKWGYNAKGESHLVLLRWSFYGKNEEERVLDGDQGVRAGDCNAVLLCLLSTYYVQSLLCEGVTGCHCDYRDAELANDGDDARE